MMEKRIKDQIYHIAHRKSFKNIKRRTLTFPMEKNLIKLRYQEIFLILILTYIQI